MRERLAGDEVGRPARGRADAPRRRARRRRRHRRPRRGARAAARRRRRLPRPRARRPRRRQQPRPRDGRNALPARRALPAGAGRERDRGDRAARRARRAPQRRTAAPSTTSACSATARRSVSSSTAAGATACCRRSRRCRRPSGRRRSPTTAPSAPPSRPRGDDGAFAIPTARSRWSDCARRARRASPSPPGSTRRASTAPALRWYLDYCCRDDYGAGSAEVSAWAGLHYFASRHGFRAPGDERAPSDGGEGVLTWPEGNAWLAERLAAPLGERLHRGPRRARRRRRPRRRRASTPGTPRPAQRERWIAARVVLATPLFVAARLLAAPPRGAARGVAHRAPCAVAGRQPAARRRARRPPRRAAVVGQRRLRAAAASATSTRCTRARGRSPGRPCSPPTSRSAATATRRSPSSAVACSATTGAPGPRAIVADLAPAHPDLAAKVRARRPDALRPRDEHSRPRRAQQRGAARARRAAAPRPLRARRPVGVLGLRGGVLPRHARRPRRRRT